MGKPGPQPKGEFDNEERARFLDLLRRGTGIHMAVQELGTSYRRYRYTLKNTRGFKREVRSAIAYREEKLVSLRYKAALEGDERAQEYLIGLAARTRQFNREMKQRRAEFAAKNPASDRSDDAPPRRIIIPDADPRHSPRKG